MIYHTEQVFIIYIPLAYNILNEGKNHSSGDKKGELFMKVRGKKKSALVLAAILAGAMGLFPANMGMAEAASMNSAERNVDRMIKTAELQLTQEWDKVFPESEKVNHSKVTFVNRYGITLAADMYVPKNATGKLPAIAVSGPFGAVKEQSSGLYAQEMAERGFLTIAFDPSFTGESGGQPRFTGC